MQNHASMPNIPEEIIHNILLYLPVKSLLRFKSVSKSWLSHISTSRFINLHSQRSNSHRILFQQFTSHLLTQSRSIIDINASFHDDSAFVPVDFPALRSQIRGSCRGFLLLELDDKFIIWNPSTLEFREIPHYYRNPTFWYGFGYDSATDDYLILLIFACPRDLTVRPVVCWVKFFSLRTNSWKNLDNNNYPYFVDVINDPYYNGAGCILDNAIHWLVLRNQDEIILAFDLTQRKFREVPLPDDFDYQLCELKVVGDLLSLIVKDHNDKQHSEMWVMREYGVKSSWTMYIKVESFDGFPNYILPLCFTKDGLLLMLYGTDLIKCNHKGELLERFPKDPQVFDGYAVVYNDTMLSLPGDDGETEGRQ